jgi:hypothetical protein
LKDDVDRDIIKRTIRWKMKELNRLKHIPYFETEEERKKKVRLKECVWKGIWNFDRFIYKLGKTTCNVGKSYTKWQESHDEYDGWNSEEGHLKNEFDGSKECKLSTEKDTSLPSGQDLTTDEELREGKAKNIILSQTQEKCFSIYIFTIIVIPTKVSNNRKFNYNSPILLLYATELSPNSSAIFILVLVFIYAVGPTQKASVREAYFRAITSGFLWSNPSHLDGSRMDGGGGSWLPR